jgi:hypothetical protein
VVVVFQATVVKAAPSGQAEAAGHIKICPWQLSRDLRPASQLCMCNCGLTHQDDHQGVCQLEASGG